MVLLFGLSIRLGTYTLSFEEIWAAFQPDDKNYFTLMEYRLPRAVLAILLGGALAISGKMLSLARTSIPKQQPTQPRC